MTGALEGIEAILTGRATSHLREEGGILGHTKALAPFGRLCREAARAGFDLRTVSVFRSYQRQLEIWNAKALGKRPLLDDFGNILAGPLCEEQTLRAILRWSALPGASRHHWGTEFDVYDHKVKGQKDVALTPEESMGPMGPLYTWLDEHLESFDFFRPYAQDLGGVAQERWHLSYRPVSEDYFKLYDFSLFKKSLCPEELALGSLVLEKADEIFERYVQRISF